MEDFWGSGTLFLEKDAIFPNSTTDFDSPSATNYLHLLDITLLHGRKHMRRAIIVGATIVLTSLALSIQAAPPVEFSYQGLLQNSAGLPLNGSVTITFQLYDAEGDPVSLSSEVKVVDVVDGKFSTQLVATAFYSDGDGDSYSDGDEKWLGITVGTDPELLPRLKITSVPLALIASRMQGDLRTKPGAMAIGDLTGDGRVDMIATSDGSSITLLDSTASGSASLKGAASSPVGVPHSVVWDMAVDVDGDGNPESSSKSKVSESAAHASLKTRTGSTTGTIRFMTAPDSTVQIDSAVVGGVLKSITTCKTHANGGFYEMKHHGTGTTSSSVSESCDATGASTTIVADDTTPGSSNRQTYTATCTLTDGTTEDMNSDDDGDGNSEARVIVRIVPADALGAGAPSSSTRLYVDSDDDGIPEQGVTLEAKNAHGHVECFADTDADGFANTSIDQDCDATGARLAIKEKGGPWGPGGSGKRTIELAGEGDSARVLIDNDSDGDGTADKKLTITLRDAAGNMTLSADSDDDGVADVSAETLVNDDSASFRLNGLPPGVPVISTIAMTATPTAVHMEAGAATCDGTDWINASDKNSKENFEQVDGAEILEKIAELPITQWNYKQDSENVKHIGPTAQDFKSTFGVGANDKSISTIDPSGIALAAIKELNKQNRELKDQNAQLKKQMEELARKVEKLASAK